nr:MAG TPA: major capsid protein [Caudoviricetes sp.]
MLKTLMLKRSLDAKRAELERLMEKDKDFQAREAELEQAINEVEPGNSEQETAVNDEIEKFDTEKTEHDESKNKLSSDIADLEGQLEEIERNAPQPNKPEETNTKKTRGDYNMEKIEIRSLPISQRAFDALPMEQRKAIVAQDDVKKFLNGVREMAKTRAIEGGGLTVPVVFLDLIAENMYRYSKLLNRVRVRNVRGEARQTIAGLAPEAVWTEMCGAISELTLGLNQITVDGYKVAGFIPVCNSLLEDSDVDLASWVVEMLSESLGLAKDKAILYGTGTNMPIGIVTRLAQDSAPANYPANAPAWVDLSDTNIITVDGTTLNGAEFWAALTVAAGNTFTRYSRGRQFWAMNSKTYAFLKSKAITFNLYGDLVANIPGVMPIIDGDVDILEFIPDGDIIGGYGDLYLWAQRSGMQIELSREVQFIQDNTVFRGKERADGTPVIAGAFVAINIMNESPTTVMNFPADTANDAQLSSLTIKGATLSPSFDPTVQSYTGGTLSANTGTILATPAQAGAQVAISVNGENVVNGQEATYKASVTNTITVTVTMGNKVRVYTVTATGAAG